MYQNMFCYPRSVGNRVYKYNALRLHRDLRIIVDKDYRPNNGSEPHHFYCLENLLKVDRNMYKKPKVGANFL